MAENKESINITIDRGERKDHHDHHEPENRDALAHRQLSAARCLLVVSVVLLALTAQVFRKTVFATPWAAAAAINATDACVFPDNHACITDFNVTGSYYCVPNFKEDGSSCGPSSGDLTCWQGACLDATNPCFGIVCNKPVDHRCVVEDQGMCSDGECDYEDLNEYTRCDPAYEWQFGLPMPSDGSVVLKGWTCSAGKCLPQTNHAVANFAYQASINAGIIVAALAIEFIVTGAFTPDLAFLAMAAGIILIGWDGKFQDIGLESNTGIGRSQLAFGFITGGLAVLVGHHWLFAKKERTKPNSAHSALATCLIIFHGVTLGMVSHNFDTTFTHWNNGEIDDDANITFNWAYTASIYAAMVALAASATIIYHGSVSNGFGWFVFTTGVIEIAWTGQHHKQKTLTHGAHVDDASFTDAASAWQSFAVIAAVFSIIAGLFWGVKPGNQKNKEVVHRIGGLVGVIIYLTMIGLVASLFQNNFLDRDVKTYGNDMREVDSNKANFGNQMSGFAWEHSIWSSAVVAAWALEGLIHGGMTAGMTALTFTKAANLLGWAAAHTETGTVRLGYNELKGRTRAWEAMAMICSAFVAVFAIHLLMGHSKQQGGDNQQGDNAGQGGAGGEQSIDQHDREAFATKGN